MKKYLFLFILIIFSLMRVKSQDNLAKINPDLLSKGWNASWINHPTESATDYGVFNFRKTFSLKQVPEQFIIHVSADNRYKLFVNEKFVCMGPSRGDLLHWHFETVDISAYLAEGDNLITAIVWNFADLKPWAQHSYKTAFIVQGNSASEELLNTNSSWKVIRNKAYSPASGKTSDGEFMVVGPCDQIDASRYPWGWERLSYSDEDWPSGKAITNGKPRIAGTGIEWGLEPREIPFMEKKKQFFKKIRISQNIDIGESFLAGSQLLNIPSNKKISFLLDQETLTTAYPVFEVSGGEGSKIKLTYSEALFDQKGQKGNRDEIVDKHIIGYSDYFYPDGGNNRRFTTLWFRTWRYVLVEIETANEPLVINKLTSDFTAYPLKEKASFESDQPDLSKIWDVGWNTARLCAGENYYDCPYYEQLQYVGDTRIQALISLYVSGDDRLVRKAIQLYDDSRFSEGLTMSRYPTAIPQVIPPYSLFWIDMIHDYWMLRDDPVFVQNFTNGIDNVLNWFIQRIDTKTGLLGKLPYWNFVDWANEWQWDSEKDIGGVPRGGYDGQSAILSLHFVYSARHAAELNRFYGNTAKAEYYETIASKMVDAVNRNCWDNLKKYIADTPAKQDFSMHTQIFAVLTDLVPMDEQQAFVQRFKNDKNLIQATMYFRFYLTRALQKSGLGDEYLSTLGLWHNMLDKGLTTFAEKPDPTRSDCHAWSASPNYDLLSLVAGILPAEPGFKSVLIKPNLGDLQSIKGQMPHSEGLIKFNLKRIGKNGINGIIEMPGSLQGVFSWRGKEIRLYGETIIDL